MSFIVMKNQKTIKKSKHQFPLADIAIFNMLTTKEINYLQQGTLTKKAIQSEFLYNSKKRNPYIYFLIEGNVKLGSYSLGSKRNVYDIIPKGSFFSVNSITDEEELLLYEYAEVISSEVNYLQINIENVRTLMYKNGKFSALILQHFFKNSGRVYKWLLVIKTSKKIEERVNNLFNHLANYYGKQVNSDVRIDINIIHQDLADLILITIPALLKVLKELEKENFILFEKNKILLKNFQKSPFYFP